MPLLQEQDAAHVRDTFDLLPEEEKPAAREWLGRYVQQQEDRGEPVWPSLVAREQQAQQQLRQSFTGGLDAVQANVSPFSANPKRDKAVFANVPFLAQRYGKTGQEIADRYEFYRNDYAAQKFGQFKDVTDEGFYNSVAGEIQGEIADEKTFLDGKKAALRGEDGPKALMAYQAANVGDWKKMLKGGRLFTQGFVEGQEFVGESLPLAEELFGIMEGRSSMTKDDGATRPAADGREQSTRLSEIVQEMATMKPRERKQIYGSITARIEAAGHDPKGFWAQTLGNLGRSVGDMGERINTKAVELGLAASAAPMSPGHEFDFTPVEADPNAERDMKAAMDLNDKMGVVRDEIARMVSGQLDPLRPTVGWLNDKVEMGLMRGPGSVAPYMMATAALGPWGAGVLAAADFSEQNRLDLIRQGLDPQDAKRVGMLAAPAQAAVESLSNMTQLGRFPAVSAFLSRFTKPVGGSSLIGRYLQNSAISLGTEFSEEQLQDNVIVPLAQNFAAALDKDVPTVGMGQIWENIKTSSPDLLFTLAPMALVFGGVMTSADANLSEAMTGNIDGLQSLGFSQAQATTIAQESSADAKVTKARELWGARAGDKTTMEAAATRLSDRLRMFQTDALAAQQELERRGILPRVLHTDQDSWRLTFNDGSVTDYGTHEEASAARWGFVEDQLGKFHALTRDTLNSLERGIEKNREIAVEFSPDVRTAANAVGDNTAQREQLTRRLEQGKALGDINLDDEYSNAIAIDKAQSAADDPLASIQILGSSRNDFKDGILRTTIKLWEGSSVLTLVEEKLEGDAKAILMQKGGRDWMLSRLRAYEAASGDKLFRDAPDDQLQGDDLVEAWSHVGQSYLVGRSTYGEPLQSKAQRRFGRLLMKAGLSGALNAESAFFAAVASRAQKLNEAKAAGKLPADLADELERQLGLDYSQARHEAGAAQEASAMAKEGGADMGGTSYSIRSGDFESRMAAAFSPFQKSPELRVAVAQVAKQRALKLGAEWIEKASVIRRVADIEREAKTREAVAADDLVKQGVEESAARSAAKQQAADWKAQAIKDSKSPASQRANLKAALRTLDGILAAAPPEVRVKVGGYYQMVGHATDEAMLKEIERRVEKLNVELEKWLRKEGIAQIEKLLKKGAPKAESGKKAKGKDADLHHLFAAAARAAEMDETAVAGELARLDALIAGGTLTPEQEVLATTERGLVELIGNLKEADAARVYSAIETLRDIYEGAWLKWKLKEIERKERRAGLRQDLIDDTGKDGTRQQRVAAEAAAKTLLGATKEKLLSLSSFHEILNYVFGTESQQATVLVDAEREASGQYEDANQKLGDEVQDLFTKIAGGSVLDGEKLRFQMSQQTIQTNSGSLSQLQGIQALLMWAQEDGKRHMEGSRDEDGKPNGPWHYDQAWVDGVESQLTPEARKVMTWIKAQYAGEYAGLNPLYRQRYGVNLPGHDNYAPITVTPQNSKGAEVVDPVTGQAVASGSVLTPGSLRTRSRNAIAEPDFRDALQTFMMHRRKLEYWRSYYDLAVEMQAVIADRSVMNAVSAKGGPEASSVLRKWIEAIAAGGFRDAASALAMNQAGARAMGRAATVALYGRVSTLLVQSTQLAAASVQMPVGAFLYRFGKLLSGNLNWKDSINSEFIQRRYRAAPPIVRQTLDSLAAAKEPNQIKRLTHHLGQLISGADALFTAGTFAILRDYHMQTGQAMGLTGAELEAHATREAERATEQVAQPTRMAARSLMEITNTAPLARAGWAYSSEARQKIALLAWSLVNWKQDKARALKTAFLTIGIGGLMSTVLKNVWKEMKGDDDEEKWSPERLVKSSLAGPLHGIPFVGEAMNDGGMFSSVMWAEKAASDIWEGEGDLRDVDTLLSTAGLFNDTLAGISSLAHLGIDAAKLLTNLVDDE